jgi:cyclomaltodextrinase / maltogenic alpha-amylase / neopullulanase
MKRALPLKRSFIRVYADNGVKRSNDLLVPLAYGHVVMDAAELDRTDLQSNVMYFAMVDRFNDADSTNNFPTVVPDTAGAIAIHPKANTLGGDLKGITQKIKDGYFTRLGINSIWISPITQNTEGAWGLWNKGITSAFSAYHGYWPTSLTRIDRRFGTDADFKELIAVAHENNINVLVDYVAHHVHQEHPLYKQKPDWTTPLYLPDGTMNTEKWDEHRLTTWFDTFLPTWNFEKPEVVDALTDTAMYWVKNYDLDGFRHDATKHIREEFWRSLTRKIKTQTPEKNLFQIGETYGNPELISSYISTGMMDAQFDFNLYDAAVDAFAKTETNYSRLAEVLLESLHYYGHHHVMGNITGNQDRARFTSYADGGVRFDENPKLAGWTRDIQNQGSVGFERMEMLTAFLMTTPGIPCIYYGDELGMPGGNDPDNRRMMFFDNLSKEQESLRKAVTQLTNLRRSHLALQYGDLRIVQMNPKSIVIARNYFGKAVFIVFHKMKAGETITFNIPEGIKDGQWKSIHGTKNSQSGRAITLSASAKGYDILH